jgi:Spy/CpxP family protein refolding chaperone
MRSKWFTFLLILSLAINVTVLATIGYHYYQNTCLVSSAPCPISPGDGHLYLSLGLSNDQLSRMEPLARKFHARLGELAALMEQKKETLIALLQKDSDPAGIENVRKEMAGIQDEIQREVITHIMESKKILDPDQRQRFFHLMRHSMIQAKNSWYPTTGGK